MAASSGNDTPPGHTPTLLFLHAHPDDECILTGSTMAKAKAVGMRVVVAYATRGDAGETSSDLGDETLGEVREREARGACDSLGADRVLFLGFDDSGMEGTETALSPTAFANVAMDEVVARLCIALVNETITAVVGYDRNGTYGHPDHIRIHEAAHAAAPALHARWVFDATYNRDHLAELQGDDDDGYDKMKEDFESFAAGYDELTHLVQGWEWFMAKGEAIRHHQSQVPDDWKDDEPQADESAGDPPTDEATKATKADETEGGPDMAGFAERFGIEWYIATPLNPGEDSVEELGALTALFEPKSAWDGTALAIPAG
jgi:LmbE family N-acetylglucosaminyl deacetylase